MRTDFFFLEEANLFLGLGELAGIQLSGLHGEGFSHPSLERGVLGSQALDLGLHLIDLSEQLICRSGSCRHGFCKNWRSVDRLGFLHERLDLGRLRQRDGHPGDVPVPRFLLFLLERGAAGDERNPECT